MPETLQQELLKRAVGEGNINVFSRPRSVNPDGSVSTIYSKGIDEDGKEVVVPGVEEHGGGILSDADATDQYRRTGAHFGKFDSPDTGDMLGEFLHKEAASGLTTPPLATSRKSVDPEHLRQVLLYLLSR